MCSSVGKRSRGEMATLTSREFNQDVARAKRAANKGPVIITDRGRPAYVLMRHDAYLRLVEKDMGIRNLLAHPESEDVAFEPPRLGSEPPQILDVE
jgi:PHD/YefM family antitoxin component YafN of YafNO toxin-antitoxin module